MSNIYLPIDNFDDYSCYVVLDKDTIRAYYQNPSFDTSVSYVDYFVNSHYLFKEGTELFSESDFLPQCINSNNFTNDFYYRNDLDSILICFLIILFVAFLIPFNIITKFFKRLR